MPRDADSGLSQRPAPEWVARPERGNTLAMRFMAWVARSLGRPAARLLLYPICLYFLAFSPNARAASRKYLAKALDRDPTLADCYRQYLTFAATILDRVFLLDNQVARLDVRVHGAQVIEELLAEGRGCFLIGAHLGSFEIIRAVGTVRGLRVSMVMYEENAGKLQSVLAAINPRMQMDVIALGKADSILKVEAALARGDVVGMLGDRTIKGEGTVPRPFFGEVARIPTGPLRVAAMLRRPVALMLALYRGGNRYDLHIERLSDLEWADRTERDRAIEQALERYVGRLEHYCRLAPYNWFNFYDYWK
jgi:predicted LPLAT superfamily acyltransferase